mgnify:CR=1 FL=1
MNDYILKIENLTKAYPGVVALNEVSLNVVRGECLALVGENGAGKSTLIKSITGAISPDSGSIFFEDKCYSVLSPALSRELGISAIYQELVLCPSLNVAENIFLGQHFNEGLFFDKRQMHEAAKKILDKFGLSDLSTHTRVRDLSVAYQQLVEIAKAIALDAKLIIMDEPTAPLTDNEVEVLFNIIDDLKKDGVTIIYISHRLNELYRVADRVAVMRDGEMINTHDIAAVTKDEIITEMVGREISVREAKKNDRSDTVVLRVDNLCGNGIEPLSFKVHEGEVLGIAGLVGSGRTELAQLIFGATKITGGQIYLGNEAISISTPGDAVKQGIGMVTEDRKETGVLQRQSVRENIVLPILRKISSKGFVSKSKEKNIVIDYIKKLNIKTPSKEQQVGNLSGGNQQKVSLAKWLANDSKLLILDEPTRGVDVGAKQEIYKLIDDLAAEGKAIIVITSDMEELINLTDRLIILYEGKYMGSLTKTEYTQELILKYASNEMGQ